MSECTECGKSVKPAKGHLGGGVMCNECSDQLVEENTVSYSRCIECGKVAKLSGDEIVVPCGCGNYD